MSLVKTNQVQLGQSGTAAQNFTLAVPSPANGTVKLARGNAGATTQDVLTVDANGNINGNVLATGTTFARNLSTRAADVINVKDFGAVGDGITNNTLAFSNAAQAAPSENAQSLQRPNIPLCDWAVVKIPSGTYLLSSTVDTGNREIVWDAHVDAVIINPQNLNERWMSGSGSPEGAITAVVGSLYTRTDGGAGTTLYVKESGTGNTGWVSK
jgi:hypothetical protein